MHHGPFFRQFAVLFILAFVLTFTVRPALALESPRGTPLLTLDGNISITNASGGTAVFDAAMFEAMETVEIVTDTPWTDGSIRFEGVRARDVLSAVGAQGSSVHAIAINDYAVDIPVEDFDNYDVILAYLADGERMGIRDKGPLWVIYPWTKHPELRNEVHHARSIWQLKRITVK